MSKSVNQVIFIGNLGSVPEFRQHGDLSIASFSVATTESWRDRTNGERRERTDWHRVEIMGRLAEIARDILTAGNEQVYIKGRLRTDRVERKNEAGVFDYFTKVHADEFIKLNSPAPRGSSNSADGYDDGVAGGDDNNFDGCGDDRVGGNGEGAASTSTQPSSAPASGQAPSGVDKWRKRGR